MQQFKNTLKIGRWWDGQLPLMMALVYYEIGLSKVIPGVLMFLLTLVMFLVSSIGIASFGYLLNDLTDREKDRQSGASNLLAHKGPRKIAAMFALVIILSFAPWAWLPRSSAIFVLITFEYLLFIAYSVKPVRLKERGIPGSAADALYGYTVPLLVAMLVFAQLGKSTLPWWQVAITAVWSFVLGLRHILVHQLKDAANDEVSGTRTTVTVFGWDKVFRLMDRWLLPTEIALFALFLISLGIRNPLLPLGYAVYLCWTCRFYHRLSLWNIANPFRLPANDRVQFITVILMSQFHRLWMPLLMLPAIVLRAHIYIAVAIMHMMLFDHGFQTLFRYELQELRRIRRIHNIGGTC